jgi:hypothetical protein
VTLPPEAEALLAAPPDEFVDERKRLAAELRSAGRTDDAREVAALRKPPAVVLAVNRAARERPEAAKAAAVAAEKLAKAQVSGDTEAFRRAGADLEQALDDLAEVAVARLSTGKPATEGMRRRAHDLLRAGVADESTRAALLRGALTEEVGFSGFEAFAGVAVPSKPSRSARRARADSKKRDEQRERKRQVQAELSAARNALRDAERAVKEATRSQDAAERQVQELESELERLRSG